MYDFSYLSMGTSVNFALTGTLSQNISFKVIAELSFFFFWKKLTRVLGNFQNFPSPTDLLCLVLTPIRSFRPEVFCEQGVIKIFTKLEGCNFVERGIPIQVFSSEFCENLKNTCLVELL